MIFINPNYPLMTTCSLIKKHEKFVHKAHLKSFDTNQDMCGLNGNSPSQLQSQLYKEKENNVEINSI